jgi:hypothetical protein
MRQSRAISQVICLVHNKSDDGVLGLKGTERAKRGRLKGDSFQLVHFQQT